MSEKNRKLRSIIDKLPNPSLLTLLGIVIVLGVLIYIVILLKTK